MTPDDRALLRTVQGLAGMPGDHLRWLLRRLTLPEKRTFDEFWPAWLHGGQAPPAGDWAVWLMLTGRGFGKTRAGAEWISGLARANGDLRIALVGATIEDAIKVMVTGKSGVMRVARTGERVTLNKSEGLVRFASLEDARKVMVEGESGLLAVARTGEALQYSRTAGVVRFPSGAEAFLYSGACPEKLRGPEHHVDWCDEIAKWRYPEETWDNLQLGLRLPGAGTRTLVTTTPRAVPLLRKLVETAAVTRGRTADNPHLPAAWVARMEAEYRGTRKGREELDGELIGEAEGALWSRKLIEACRGVAFAGAESVGGERWIRRVVIGVDPPASAAGDACGIIACAVTRDGIAHVSICSLD